jgi:hypothetical protein
MNDLEAAVKAKSEAYAERNQLVAFLSHCYPSHLMRHDYNDATWDRDWVWIVCINSPKGQMTWHIHKDELPLFDHLQQRNNDWDGHSTEEKYARLSMLGVSVCMCSGGCGSKADSIELLCPDCELEQACKN